MRTSSIPFGADFGVRGTEYFWLGLSQNDNTFRVLLADFGESVVEQSKLINRMFSTKQLYVILRAAPEESISNQQEREMNLQAGAWFNRKILRYVQYDVIFVILRATPEESVSTIFSKPFRIIRSWNKFRMTTKCHAELSLIYFTIQILRYAQYD